jgi:MFS family permease
VAATTLVNALSALAMSRVHSVALATLLFLPAGAGWTGTFSSTSTLVQLWTPDRLRARTVALYTVAQFAMWAAGSTAGGLIAERWDVRAAMLVGSLACLAAGLLTARLPLPDSFVGPPPSVRPPHVAPPIEQLS